MVVLLSSSITIEKLRKETKSRKGLLILKAASTLDELATQLFKCGTKVRKASNYLALKSDTGSKTPSTFTETQPLSGLAGIPVVTLDNFPLPKDTVYLMNPQYMKLPMKFTNLTES